MEYKGAAHHEGHRYHGDNPTQELLKSSFELPRE
jgi:hypothetical protein